MPFLQKNHIIVDAHAGRVTDNRVKYDLISPIAGKSVPPERKKKLPSPHQRLQTTRKYRCTLLQDLKQKLCNIKRRLTPKTNTQLDIAAVTTAIRSRVTTIEEEATLEDKRQQLLHEFKDVFAEIPHVKELPSDVLAEIKLKDANHIFQTRSYGCPRKYRDAWQTLINQHLAAGRIRESAAATASPAFIIPKADPNALPRWVNDYRQLNKNTVPDSYPLPRIDNILADCGKGKIWGTIDMTNAFFQTRMKPSDIPLTAVTTPFGLYEWCVMPMGLQNTPAIHQ